MFIKVEDMGRGWELGMVYAKVLGPGAGESEGMCWAGALQHTGEAGCG